MENLLVKKLIEELKKLPQDSRILVEGCDCVRDATGVILFDDWDGEESGNLTIGPAEPGDVLIRS